MEENLPFGDSMKGRHQGRHVIVTMIVSMPAAAAGIGNHQAMVAPPE